MNAEVFIKKANWIREVIFYSIFLVAGIMLAISIVSILTTHRDDKVIIHGYEFTALPIQLGLLAVLILAIYLSLRRLYFFFVLWRSDYFLFAFSKEFLKINTLFGVEKYLLKEIKAFQIKRASNRSTSQGRLWRAYINGHGWLGWQDASLTPMHQAELSRFFKKHSTAPVYIGNKVPKSFP